MKMAKKTRKTLMRLALAGSLPLVLISIGVLAGSNSISLPNGAELQVSVDDPITCTEFQVPHDQATIDVPVTGTASVGLGEPDGTLVYVIDVSASTNRILAGGNCGGDTNGDGISNMVLDCEVAAVLALNAAAIPEGSIDEVGVVVYGETGAAGDMSPGGGDDLITAPDANGDVATVVQSVRSYYDGTPCPDAGLRQFTSKSVGCNGTDFSAGLAAAKTVVDASNNNTNIVIFLSDGLSNQQDSPGFNSNLDALVGTGAVIYSFAVGDEANCSGGGDGTLQQMADASVLQNGAGGCTNVVTPADLPDILPDLIGSTLQSLEIEVDGGGKQLIPDSAISLTLPLPGAVSVDHFPIVPGLEPGDHDICVTANGSDVTLTHDSVTQCETIHLLQLAYGAGTMPEDINAVNDLNFQTEHTVTVQIAGGTGRQDIDFEVTGHNAGAMGARA